MSVIFIQIYIDFDEKYVFCTYHFDRNKLWIYYKYSKLITDLASP